MYLRHLIEKLLPAKQPARISPPLLTDAFRFPYGPFRFKSNLPKNTDVAVQTSTDLRHWLTIHKTASTSGLFEYLDTDAAKFSHRFYRLLAGSTPSANVLGYAAVSLPPGFTMIANPFQSHLTVADCVPTAPPPRSAAFIDTPPAPV